MDGSTAGTIGAGQVADDSIVVRDIVRRAWVETLPNVPFRDDLSWEDAGADSLTSLQFVMRLEEALGRKISYDLITRHMTAPDLVEALAGQSDPSAAENDAPRVFFLPGVFGDGSVLAEFRRRMIPLARFELIDFPGLDQPIAVHRSVPAMARLAAEEIVRRAPDGDIALTGHSFGGMVAAEAAHQLETVFGRRVVFLGLIDTLMAPDPAYPALSPEIRNGLAPDYGLTPEQGPARPRSRWLRLLAEIIGLRRRRTETLRSYRNRLVFSVLVSLRLMEAARRFTERRPAADAFQQIRRRKILLGGSRHRAMRDWKPGVVDTPALLIVGLDGTRQRLPERWAAICPNLQVDSVAFPHMDMLCPEAVLQIAAIWQARVRIGAPT